MQVEICSENYKLKNKYICPKEISNKLDQSINSIVAKTGFIKCNIEKKPVCTNGGNFLGILHEIDIKGRTKEGDKELNIFVKSVIPGENDLEMISVNDVYRTEVFTYKELSKIFEELQDEAQVPINERYKMVKSYDESNSELIIMENLSKKGFSTGHRMDVPSLEFAEMAIKELAKFHALSFVIKEKRPIFFENHIKTRKPPFNIGEQWHGCVQNVSKVCLNHIDEDDKERVGKFCEVIPEKFRRYHEDKTNQRCLCHGDYRPNNILMKMIDGAVSEIIPVDYQLMQYGCPVLDILFFVMSCTDQKFRRAHLAHLKELYHETMTKFLKYFNIDVNLCYPKKEFENEFMEKLDYGLIYAFVYLAFMFASEDDVPDITKKGITSINFKVDDKFKDRIQGIVKDYIEWGVI